MGNTKEIIKEAAVLPIVALRGLVLFPNSIMHFEVGRKKSVLAINAAVSDGSDIFLVPQKSVFDDDPQPSQISEIGVIACIKHIVKIAPDNIRVVVEGKHRAFISDFMKTKPYLKGEVMPFDTYPVTANEEHHTALVRQAKKLFEKYARVAAGKISPDVVMNVMEAKRAGRLADYIASNIMLDFEYKLELLGCLDPMARLSRLCVILSKEIALLSIEKEIQDKVQEQIDENQREYFLREQMKIITKELGEDANNFDDGKEFANKIRALKLHEETEEKLLKEADKLSRMPETAHEAMVARNYLETCLSLPWNISTKDKTDIARASKVLDRDHYGLEKVKERILEMIAVRALSDQNTGQIICLVGPPGVGKTSIARSVATAMGKKYARISLGGVRDEAEIRGHRRTYIGAMTGRIMSAVIQAKSNNALILLDEIDKLGADYKGDPSSALLEALDPEQNGTFCDHYIDVPFDLSRILFMTTANSVDTIPAPLLDRMEVIELPSYTAQEKFHICKKHIIPKQIGKNGLSSKQLKISDDAIRVIIDGYTREGGVRNLERLIGKICRKTAKEIVGGLSEKVSVKPDNIEKFLGAQKFKRDAGGDKDEIGVVNGLAWTAVGGEMLKIEVVVLEGTGKLELTGSLGDVMKESAKAALSYVRSRVKKLDIDPDFYKNKDIHIHVPEGAVPKDGPSAGVTITTALVSALTGLPAKHDVAMTGEVTLTGRVLTIGGLREKSMAAYLTGKKTVFVPMGNKSDIEEISDEVRRNVEFVPVENVDEIIDRALVFPNKSARSDMSILVEEPKGNFNAVMQ
ncbi:MAG: endopeptidase La [Clostridia bacterium]|nr:endopeptidase La [Clostridia bacterium]